MDVSEKWGTDVETAVNLALEELDATIDEVDVTVLEQPSRGFFGIGSKLALVRVEKKPKPKAMPKEKVDKTEREIPAKAEKQPEKAGASETAKKVQPEKEDKAEEKRPTKKRKPESIENKAPEIPDIFEVKEQLTDVEEHEAIDFLEEVIEQMGLEISVKAKKDEENVFVYMEGKDAGTIIGKRGQTLDALQYLTSLVVNKDSEDYTRIVLDAENYRTKREKTLKRLAARLGNKVARTGRSIKLEPMNPYERKIIHSTLQSDSRVVTRSEGQDPYRRVIIELK